MEINQQLLDACSTQAGYGPMAMQTLSSAFNIRDPRIPVFIHGVMGLTGEINEYRQARRKDDVVNMLEELGDATWFAAALNSAFGFPAEAAEVAEPDFYSTDELVEALDEVSHELQNSIKRLLFYPNYVLNESEFQHQLCLVMGLLDALAVRHGSTSERVRAGNLVKLMGKGSRYEGAFSDVAALVRDLGRERGILESVFGLNQPNE
jgi:hypothetical protein